MIELDNEIIWTIIRVIYNSSRHREFFSTRKEIEFANADCFNLKYLYMFPLDNSEEENIKKYKISTRSLYEYFLQKNYIFTVCNFNGCPSEGYSWNTNSVALLLPEYIDFGSNIVRSKLKLSDDISYLDVFYNGEIKQTLKQCYSILDDKDKDIIKNSKLTKAMLNEFTDR